MIRTCCFVLLGLLWVWNPRVQAQSYPTQQLITSQPSVISMTRPGYLTFSAIPGLQTEVARLSDLSVFPAGEPDYTHIYSTTQPWNSDGTRLMLMSVGPTGAASHGHFLDGNTYAYLFSRTNVPNTIRWSATNPDLMYGVSRSIRAFVSFVPSTGTITTLHDFTSEGFSELYIGNGQGNLSVDGRYVPLIAITGSGSSVVIVWDTTTNTEVSRATVSAGGIDWAGLSPSGTYVVVQGNPVQVRARTTMALLRNINLGGATPGHADLCYDTAGNEVYVGLGNNYDVMSARLDTGATQTHLPGTGQSASYPNVYMAYNQHTSCQNTARPGYAYISTYAWDAPNEAYLHREIFAVKLDGSGNLERWTQNFNCCYGSAGPDRSTIPAPEYQRSSRAVPSPDGTRVLFASDWNVSTVNTTIFDYLVRMPVTAGPTTLVAKLLMNDGAGTTVTDSSGNALHGQLCEGATCATVGPVWQQNRLGFDGVNDGVRIANNALFNFSGDLTVGMKVKLATTGDMGIAGKAGAAQTPFDWVVWRSANTLCFTFNGASASGFCSTGTLTDLASEHLLAVTKSGTTVTFYIDATNVGTITMTGTMTINTVPVWFGTDQGVYFTGTARDARVYNGALTPAEIATWAGEAAPPSGPLAAPTVLRIVR